MFDKWSRLAAYCRVMFAVTLAIGGRSLLADELDAEKPTVFELTVPPAAEPAPALKYHLLPPPEELVQGNAAPIYLRVIWEQNLEWHKRLREESPRLLKYSLAELPLDEAKQAVSLVDRELEQFASASLRTDCNWEYVAEDDPLLTLLPDAQSLRTFGFAIALQTRIHVRENNPQAAVDSLRNGLALAHNIAKGPFLVTELVGLSISENMLSEVDQLIACTNSPNLYWALAELPSPLVSFRQGLGSDSALIRDRFPELALKNAAIDWNELAREMRQWAVEVARLELPRKPAADIDIHVEPEKLSAARKELPTISEFTTEQVSSMSAAEVEVRYTLALHRVIYDQWRKWYYVPFDRLPAQTAEQADRLREDAQQRELYPLVSVLAPLRGNLRQAQQRVERLIARQQLIEALRMQAAANGGFPKALEDITVVPAPLDPATGRPFRYQLDGEVAVLDVDEASGMTRESLRLPVRIRLRK